MSVLSKMVLRKIVLRCFYASLLTCGLFFLSAQTPQVREYQVKAVFLFNFTQFIEWPLNTFSEATSPMIIGILGTDPFGPYLDETISKEEVNGHPLVVQRYGSIEEMKTCHILFISADEVKKMEQLIPSLKERSILTVSDASDFIQEGGMIRLYTTNNKIHIKINPEAAKNAGLTISSKLLRVAEIFVPKEKKER